MLSLSTQTQNVQFNNSKKIITNNIPISLKEQMILKGNYESMNSLGLIKSENGKGRGAVNKNNQIKGIIDPPSKYLAFGTNPDGVRERFYKIDFNTLREISRKVSLIAAIQQTRIQQLRPFAYPSFNEEKEGYMIKLKDRDRTPTFSEKKKMEEINNFIFFTGYRDFNGADEREDRFPQVMEKLTRDELTIDQIAIQPQYNKKGKMIAYWLMDGSTIKRTVAGQGYKGNEKIKYVQQIRGENVATFEKEELLFYVHNPRSDLNYTGYGYSLIEQCLSDITAWLYGMTYNKEVFNSSAMPKGILSFEGEQLDQGDLEELQREWQGMFSGISGMWKTPFLQYNAKWQNMAPSNRDMEWNVYIQFLSSLICSVHGIDAQEMGLRFNQAQNVLSENVEKKIVFSKDRGLKDLLSFHSTCINRLLEFNPEWEDFRFCFTGFESKDQMAELQVKEKRVLTTDTINEIRAEEDKKPLPYGDIVLNPQYLQYIQSKEMQGQQTEQKQNETETEEKINLEDFDNFTSEEIEQTDKSLEKSFKENDIITINLI